MRAQAPRGAAVGDQDLRLDLQEPPDDRARGGADRRPAAGGGGLPRAPGRRRPLLRRSTRTEEKKKKKDDFVENAGGATTADMLALMAEGRRRVHERFGVVLEPEVQVLGEVEWPEAWDPPAPSCRAFVSDRAGAAARERESPSCEDPCRHARGQAARHRERRRPPAARRPPPAPRGSHRPGGRRRRRPRERGHGAGRAAARRVAPGDPPPGVACALAPLVATAGTAGGVVAGPRARLLRLVPRLLARRGRRRQGGGVDQRRPRADRRAR